MKISFDFSSTYEPIEDGHYTAALVSITPKTKMYGDSYEFLFEIVGDEEYAGRRIGRLLKASPMMRRWINVLTGDTVTKEDPHYDLDKLLHKSCEIQIETKLNKNRIVDIYTVEGKETNV